MAPNRKKSPGRDVIRLGMYLPYQVARLSDRLVVQNAGLHEGSYKLTTQEWKVLSIIADFGPVTPAEIRRQSTQDKSTVSWAIKRLDRRKFLNKAREPGDARTFRVTLSRAGWRYYAAIVPKSRKIERDVLKALTKTEAAQFRRLLEKLIAE